MSRRSSCPNLSTSSMSQRRLRAKQIRAKKRASFDAHNIREQTLKKHRTRQLRLHSLQIDCKMRRHYTLKNGKALCNYCQHWIPEIMFEDHTVQHPTHIRQRIWLGNADNSQDLQVMKRCKITHILNCTKEIQIPPAIYSIILDFKRISIQDKTCETIMDYMTDVCRYIEQCLSQSKDHVLFIHCREGRSRSVSFLCMYLMWKESISFHAALSDVRSKRHIVLPNSKFYHELELFDTQLCFDRTLSPRLRKFGNPNGTFVLQKCSGLLPEIILQPMNINGKIQKLKKRNISGNEETYKNTKCEIMFDDEYSLSDVELKFGEMNVNERSSAMPTIIQSPNTEENQMLNQMFEFNEVLKQKNMKLKKKKRNNGGKRHMIVRDIFSGSVSASNDSYDGRSIASVASTMSNYSSASGRRNKQRSKSSRKKRKKKKSGELDMATAIRNMF